MKEKFDLSIKVRLEKSSKEGGIYGNGINLEEGFVISVNSFEDCYKVLNEFHKLASSFKF